MIELTEQDLQTAPCLRGSAIASAARDAIVAARRLGVSPAAALLRTWGVAFLWGEMRMHLAGDAPPAAGIAAALRRAAGMFTAAADCSFEPPTGTATARPTAGDVAERTGEHYGRLFAAIPSDDFWATPVELLQQRLSRNRIELPALDRARVLDAGCGGGRFSFAWRLLGAVDVLGVDVSEISVVSARERAGERGIEGVSFAVDDVLALRRPDSSFDIVYSNGVLSHTTDWRQGVRELLRVLRPGGLGWLYMLEDPGGLYWDVNEINRVILAGDSPAAARGALEALGVPSVRAAAILDHATVPLNLRLPAAEVEEHLRSCGATAVRRLTRGSDRDRVEQIHRQVAHAVEKFGIGENRFVFSKGRPAA